MSPGETPFPPARALLLHLLEKGGRDYSCKRDFAAKAHVPERVWEHVLCKEGELHARTHRDGELPVDLEGVLCIAEDNKKESARQKEKKEKNKNTHGSRRPRTS